MEIENLYREKFIGSRAIGIDRVDSSNFAKKSESEIELISRKVLSGTYQFTKYKEKLISKGVGKIPRQLSIPTIRDRLTLKIVCQLLFLIFPEAKPALPQERIQKISDEINTGKYSHFIKIDLKEFYPSINHKILLSKIHKRARIPNFKKLILDSLQNPTVPEANTKNKNMNALGVSQGLSISNALAEIFMLDIDENIRKIAPFYLRFVDDIIILTNESPEVICDHVCKILSKSKLNPHRLGLPGSKTQIGDISDGFDFLGYFLNQSNVSIRKSSLFNFEGALVKVFTEYKHRLRSASNLTEKETALKRFRWALNLKLTGCIYKGQRFGWVFYYSQITDLAVLRKIDHTVGMLTKRFAIPNPPKPKRTLKAFFESKRTNKESHSYIPNYDSLNLSKITKFLTEIGFQLGGYSDVNILITFQKMVRRATRSLERDVANLS